MPCLRNDVKRWTIKIVSLSLLVELRLNKQLVHCHKTSGQRPSNFNGQASNASRSPSGIRSCSTLSTELVVNKVKGTRDPMVITDASAAVRRPLLWQVWRGPMLRLFHIVWPCPWACTFRHLNARKWHRFVLALGNLWLLSCKWKSDFLPDFYESVWHENSHLSHSLVTEDLDLRPLPCEIAIDWRYQPLSM